jgi:hypothetical protein
MPRAGYKDILESVPYLKRNELEELRLRVNFNLKAKSTSPVKEPIESEDWILEGIKTEIERRGLMDKGMQFRIKNNTSFQGFQTKSQAVRELLAKAAPDLTVIERRYLGEVAAKELARYIEGWNSEDYQVVISLHTLLRYVDRIPEAIEHSFPGYIASQMLGIIITHRFK